MVNKLNDYEKGFIEGFLDADGSITMSKNRSGIRSSVSVSFFNNSIEVLEKIKNIVGIEKKIVRKKNSSNYQFVLRTKASYELLKQIKLIVKENRRKNAIKMHEFVQSCGGSSMNQYNKPFNYETKIEEIVDAFYNA